MARALAGQGANVTLNGFGNKDAIEQLRVGIEKDSAYARFIRRLT